MTFTAGDRVHITAIGTGTIREVRNGKRCLVEVKGRSMLVDITQLEAADVPRPRKIARASGGTGSPENDDAPTTRRAPTLDLHGKTVDEAVEALDRFLNDALLDGHPVVHIIHGRSGGRVKSAVHAQLRRIPSVLRFQLDPRNAGVTLVSL